MYSATETVGLELKYTAKDQLRGGLASARGTLTKFSSFAHGIANKVAAGFRRMWAAATGPVGMLVGGAGLAGVGFGIKSYLKGAVEIAGDWEGYLAKLTVALKSATKAADMFAWAKQFAATTPFEMGEVVDATTRLELYGLSAKKWIPLVGDMAGAMGRDIVDAVEAIADAVSGGGLERLKEFGISSTQLLKYGAKPGMGGGVSYMGEDAINRLKKALIGIMSERYGGGMTKLLATWTGKTSNLADAWTQIKGRIGEGMMPVLKRIVDKTTEWLNLLLKSGIGEKVGKKLGEWIEWAWKKAQGFVNYFIENWPTIKKTLEETWENIKTKIGEVVDKAKEWLGTSTDTGGKLEGASLSLTSMATSAVAIAESFKSIDTTMEKVKIVSAQLKQFWTASSMVAWKIALAFAYAFELQMKMLRWGSPLGLSKKFREATAGATASREYVAGKANQAYTDFLAATENVYMRKQRLQGQAGWGQVTQGGGGGAALPTAAAMPTARQTPGYVRNAYGQWEPMTKEQWRLGARQQGLPWSPEGVPVVNVGNWPQAGQAFRSAARTRQSSAGTEFGH